MIGQRHLFGLAVALAAASIALGCGGDDDDASGGGGAAAEKKTKIMVFYPGPRGFNDVTRRFFIGFEQAKAELEGKADVEIKGMSSLEVDPGAYVNYIREALVSQPDGIVVTPNLAEGMKAGLEQIASQGTEILLMNEDIPDMKDKVAFVGSNNSREGALAGEYLVEQHEAGQLKSNKVAMLVFTPGWDATDRRAEGFEQAVEGSPLEIVAKRVANCADGAESRAKMADVLSANPDLGAVFSVCDGTAIGAAQALKSADRLDVQQVSIDALTPALDLIQSNAGLNADVAAQLVKMAKQSVLTLDKALRGEQVPAHTEAEPTLITKDNVDDVKELLSE